MPLELPIPRLGLGCGALGESRVTDRDAEALLGAAVDLGVTLFDAARSYGLAEERLGRFFAHAHAHRRDAVLLSTKGGYAADGAADWTADAITLGIDQALARLRTDRIDVFHLHSCPLDVLQRGDLLDALDRARAAGKIRLAAYSGDNDELAWAVDSGRFDSVQCSVNVFDQHALRTALPRAVARGLPVLAKRALGNAAWAGPTDAPDPYAERLRAMRLDPAPLAWPELAVRFAAHAPGVTCALVGTASVEHLRAAARAVAAGPLPDATTARIRAAFDAAGAGWPARI